MRRVLVLIKNILDIPYRLLCTNISVLAILQDSKVNKTAAISTGVKFYRGKVGRYSYINRGCFITDTNIGNFVSIGSGCEIGGAAHPLNWVSTSPVFHKWKNIMKKNFSHHDFKIFSQTNIGSDVWIGSKCLIKAGVTIDNGSIIGMGSVVTKDIGPYEVWAGNPARLIRKRFDDEIVIRLLNTKWWELEDDEINKYASKMTNVKEFLQEMEKKK